MPEPILSQAQYVATLGCRCPYCNSHDVESTGRPEFDADGATRDVACNACNRTWQDVYRLAGFQTPKGTAHDR